MTSFGDPTGRPRGNLVLFPGGKRQAPAQQAPYELTDAIEQFELPFEGVKLAPRSLVSLGIDSCWFDDFHAILKAIRIGTVIDIRLSPSFHGRGFELVKVFGLLGTMGIQYVHMPELGNRFLGDDWNFRTTLVRYRNHLMTNPDPVSRLCEFVATQSGPFLLLGRAPDDDHSERSIIVDAMRRHLNTGVPCYLASELLTSLNTSGKLEA